MKQYFVKFRQTKQTEIHQIEKFSSKTNTLHSILSISWKFKETFRIYKHCHCIWMIHLCRCRCKHDTFYRWENVGWRNWYLAPSDNTVYFEGILLAVVIYQSRCWLEFIINIWVWYVFMFVETEDIICYSRLAISGLESLISG